MAITILRDLPLIVYTRTNTWMQVELSVGKTLQIEVIYSGSAIVTLKFPVDVNNRVSYNLKKFLQAMGTVPDLIDIHLPAFNQAFFSVFNKNLRSFSVVMTELLGTEEIANGTVSSTCLLAGINYEYVYGTTLLDFLSLTPKRFLTNKPLRKSTSVNTQEYLYFYNRDEEFNDGIALKLRLYFTDGTTSGVLNVSPGSFDFSLPTTVILPVGYAQLGIDTVLPTGKEVASYDVFLTAGGLTTEIHTFDIDRRCYENGRDLIFLNSLGGVDTVRIGNVEEVNLRIEKEQVERFIGMANTPIEGQYYDINIQTNREFRAVTYLATESERLWMQELFASDRVFEIQDGKFLPIRITSGNVPLRKGSIVYQSVQFDYRYRFDDIGYTRPL